MVKFANDIFKTLNSVRKGMGITLGYFFKKPVTQQFPDERWALPERFRGFVHNDVPRCTACMLCAKACPSDAIEFGDRADILAMADARLAAVQADGFPNAKILDRRDVRLLILIADEASMYSLTTRE